MFSYRVIVFFVFFQNDDGGHLDLEVKMFPNLKNKHSIEFVV